MVLLSPVAIHSMEYLSPSLFRPPCLDHYVQRKAFKETWLGMKTNESNKRDI